MTTALLLFASFHFFQMAMEEQGWVSFVSLILALTYLVAVLFE